MKTKTFLLFLFFLPLFYSCQRAVLELDVLHQTTGNLALEIENALKDNPRKVRILKIRGNAVLDKNDCKAIKQKFYSCDLELLDLSKAKFENNTIPSSSEGAFSCMKMQKVILPSGLEIIGYKAFFSCTRLEEINMPKGLKRIRNNAFASCVNLQIEELPDSIETLGESIFENCKKLSIAKLPERLKGAIGDNAFSNTQVAFSLIPSGVTTVGEKAFANSKITEIHIPYGMEEIGSAAFQNCELKTLHFYDVIAPWIDNRRKTSTFKGVELSQLSVNIPTDGKKNYIENPWDKVKQINEFELQNVFPLKNPRRYKITFGGFDREYLAFIPQNTSKKKPEGMILLLHALGETMYDILQRNNIMMIADDINMVLLAPQALPIQDKKIRKTISKYYPAEFESSLIWNSGLGIKGVKDGKMLFNFHINESVNDLEFLKHIVDNVADDYSVDKKNLFVLGTSMGGCMAYQYALHYGKDLAGLINIAGTMGIFTDTLKASEPLSILDIHSTSDNIIPYNGVHTLALNNLRMETTIGMSVDEVLKFWARKNGSSHLEIENLGSKVGISVEKHTYAHSIHPITHYKVTGGIHTTELVLPKHPISYRNEILSFILSNRK